MYFENEGFAVVVKVEFSLGCGHGLLSPPEYKIHRVSEGGALARLYSFLLSLLGLLGQRASRAAYHSNIFRQCLSGSRALPGIEVVLFVCVAQCLLAAGTLWISWFLLTHGVLVLRCS